MARCSSCGEALPEEEGGVCIMCYGELAISEYLMDEDEVGALEEEGFGDE